jgi:amino acid adenylation domain-containing protein
MSGLGDLLTLSADRFPDKTAIEDPASGACSYADLREAADRIARALADIGVRRGDRVGICAPKSIGTVAAIFGILRAEAAYVPVDSTAPAERNAHIFRDCSVKAVLTVPALIEDLHTALDAPRLDVDAEFPIPGVGGSAISLARIDWGGVSGEAAPIPDLAYILYTSGSTGRPKGVMHSHGTALSFVNWCSQELRPTDRDRFSSHAPFHFDLSILDLYVSLKHGATLVLIGEELGKQPQQLAELIAEERLSIWYSTPSILRLLVEFGRMERFDYPALRIVIYAGEVFPPKHQRALRARWPRPVYYNLYGPTETNVCTYDKVTDVPPDDHQGPLPIGSACSGDRTRAVNADGLPVPPGEEGELLVSGGSVMLGYWNLPENNSRVFAREPDGTRWYRTGDMVVDQGGGYYLFLGRRDRMVKRRGYRVELAEIEAALHGHDCITEAGVIAIPDPESGVLIKAFVAWTGGSAPSTVELKSFAAMRLPAYMIPDRFVVLPSLPKTSTDKIDYQKLRELQR